MKKIVLLLIGVFFFFGVFAQKNILEMKGELEDNFNFMIVTDIGRNGYYDQKPVARLMGKVAEEIGIEFIAASGDIHHYKGIESVSDPLWMTNFELIYDHPELQVEWYPVLGNHEYQGNTQAVIDYSKFSRRWCMPSRYYSQIHSFDNGKNLKIVYIDTPPLIDKYRENSKEYPDAVKQNMEKQLVWIDSVLSAAPSTWTLVIGHHPIHAETSKEPGERGDMQKRVEPILKKYNTDVYISGHIHNFQHIRMPDSQTDYIVNSSGSLSRKVKPVGGTVFCDPSTGFIFCSVFPKKLMFYFINNTGEIIHTLSKEK